MINDFLRTDAHPARNDLPLLDSEVLGPVRLRSRCSEWLSIPEEQILLGDDPDELIALIARTMVDPEERVAVFQPCPEGHLNAVLQAGGRYVDCGRSLDWAPRMDGLELVVGDGAVVVLIALPNSPVDGGDAGEIMTRIEALSVSSTVRCVLVDRRHDRGRISAFSRPSILQLASMPCTDSSHLHALVGSPQCIEALARMRGRAGLEDRDIAEQWAGDSPHLMEALVRQGFEGVVVAEGVWIQNPGTSSSELAVRLRERGFEVRVSQHHAWREGLLVTSLGGGESR